MAAPELRCLPAEPKECAQGEESRGNTPAVAEAGGILTSVPMLARVDPRITSSCKYTPTQGDDVLQHPIPRITPGEQRFTHHPPRVASSVQWTKQVATSVTLHTVGSNHATLLSKPSINWLQLGPRVIFCIGTSLWGYACFSSAVFVEYRVNSSLYRLDWPGVTFPRTSPSYGLARKGLD